MVTNYQCSQKYKPCSPSRLSLLLVKRDSGEVAGHTYRRHSLGLTPLEWKFTRSRACWFALSSFWSERGRTAGFVFTHIHTLLMGRSMTACSLWKNHSLWEPLHILYLEVNLTCNAICIYEFTHFWRLYQISKERATSWKRIKLSGKEYEAVWKNNIEQNKGVLICNLAFVTYCPFCVPTGWELWRP